MKVRYLYSACVVVETPDVNICCDPWFTDGLYEGSWYQYPPMPRDPIDIIGPADVIFISHVHNDHYDPKFLRRYLKQYPGTRIVIGKSSPPILEMAMRAGGFNPEAVDTIDFGDTKLHIFPNQAHKDEQESIDSALVVARRDLSVANMNDNSFDPNQVAKVLAVCPGGRPTFALLGASGAGSYPQVYEFESQEALEAEAERMRAFEMGVYARFLEALNPVRAMPFAGKFYLGGPLSVLNPYRAVSDEAEVLVKHADVSLVLADGGEAYFDLETLEASELRTEPHDPEEIDRFLASIPFEGYHYEREIQPIDGRPLPLQPLVTLAYEKALQRTKVREPYFLCLRSHGWTSYMAFDTSQGSGVEVIGTVDHLVPRLEIFLDERYLFGLMTRMYSWGNGPGCHYRAKRVPHELYKREVYDFFHGFHI